MEQDLVSIIVPCYNRFHYLKDVFLSIKNQTYQNIEVIFVDDGSTDDTSNILDNFAKTYTRVKVVHKINGGLSSARNAGLAIAKGKYIYFMDADDVIHPETISYLCNLMKKHDADLANFRFKTISSNYSYSNNFCNYSKRYDVLTDRDQIYTKFLADVNGGRSVCFKLILHNLLKDLPGYPRIFNEKCFYGEDLLLSSILFKKVRKVIYSKAKLYLYRKAKNSMVHSPFKEKDLSLFMFEDNVNNLDSNVYPVAIKYVPSLVCFASMNLLYRLKCSAYNNPKIVKEIYHRYRDNLKYLPRLSLLPLAYRFGTIFTLPYIYLSVRKKIKG